MSNECDAKVARLPLIEATLRNRGSFPVRTVYGIGRNYAAHAKELGNSTPAAPVVFLKPASCLTGDGGTILLPTESADVQHEVEIVVLLSKGGRHLDRTRAIDLIAGYGVGIDVTARDLQRKAQAAGHPWTIAKGFETFGPISEFVPADEIADHQHLAFNLMVNGQLRQQGNSGDMLFDFGALISYLSTIFLLEVGDLIFTGTPEGVARITAGDRLHARLADYDVSVNVTAISSVEA
jgi:2-keto-4-pentenoate hydratase/2-oxohepta-3-ene-1,7-dioic acid hydratase in catechol pathway